MTTLEVRASVLRDIAALMENDSAMLQLQEFLSSLKNNVKAGVKSYKDIAAREDLKFELREALQEMKDVRSGKTERKTMQDLYNELETLG